MTDRFALGIMVRAPSDERGKTRLIRALGVGSESGAALRRAILLDTLEAMQPVAGVDRVLLVTPNTGGREVADLAGDSWHLLGQRGETLGERLEHAFVDLFALGYAAAALVGSDLPTLPAAYVAQGIEALTRQSDPVVLGPAEDGGYYFIALRRAHPELLRGIPWSTADVLKATRMAAYRMGLHVTLIPSWYDVDSPLDFRRAVDTASSRLPGAARHLREWVAAGLLGG